MKLYKFKIGNKEFECIAPSSDAAFKCCYDYCSAYGWKGRVELLTELERKQ
jgi:hypothetical protein